MAHRLGGARTGGPCAADVRSGGAGGCVGLIGEMVPEEHTAENLRRGARVFRDRRRPERSAAILGGSGFDFELTGRENVMRAAAMMGLAHQQIVDRVEAIRTSLKSARPSTDPCAPIRRV